MMGRAEVSQACMVLSTKSALNSLRNPRFSNTRLTRYQHDRSFALFSPFPSPHEQVDFLVPPDQPGERRAAQCFEPARDDARTQHLPSRHRCGDTLDLDGAEIAVLEEISH